MSLSRVGTATGTTSATLPSFNDGDLAVVFAFRDGSTTAPSLPSGWTNIANNGANTCSGRIGYRILRTGDTTTGTWTNATSVIVHVYRSSFGGGHARPGANNTSGAASTTVTYNSLTMQNGDGTSWVAGFAGHRSTDTSLETAPSGMGNRSTVNDATDEAAGHDTGGGVTSWSSTNVSVGGTSSGWRSYTLEIREYTATGIQLVNSVRSAGDSASGTTLTAAMQVSKDSWLVFGSRYENASSRSVTISDDTTGESYSSSVAHHDATAAVGVDLTAGKTGQSGLVTFTQTIGAASTFREFFVLEYVNVAASSQLDKTDTRSQTASNPSTDAFTPDTNGELVVGLAANTGATTYNAGGSFTERFDGAIATDTQIEDFVQTTAASISASWTAVSDLHVMVAASYRPLSSGLSATVNQVTETDLAQAIAWAPKKRLVGQISETDLAQALTRRKTLGVLQVSEADLAQALTSLKRVLLGQAQETDLAQALVMAAKIVAVAQVTESDLAQAVSWAPKRRLVVQALESDTAFTITADSGAAVRALRRLLLRVGL